MDVKQIKQLSELVSFSLSQKEGKKQVLIGYLNDRILDSSLKKGVNLKGFKVYVDNSAVRHAFKRHGVKSIEARNGRIPICVFDVMLLPELIKEGELIEITESSLVISKNKFGIIGDIICELRISNKKGRRIYLKTMFNKKRGRTP